MINIQNHTGFRIAPHAEIWDEVVNADFTRNTETRESHACKHAR